MVKVAVGFCERAMDGHFGSINLLILRLMRVTYIAGSLVCVINVLLFEKFVLPLLSNVHLQRIIITTQTYKT